MSQYDKNSYAHANIAMAIQARGDTLSEIEIQSLIVEIKRLRGITNTLHIMSALARGLNTDLSYHIEALMTQHRDEPEAAE